jgi:hypothetical protein
MQTSGLELANVFFASVPVPCSADDCKETWATKPSIAFTSLCQSWSHDPEKSLQTYGGSVYQGQF